MRGRRREGGERGRRIDREEKEGEGEGEIGRRRKEGGKSQKLMLFMRGNAMSGAPIIRGISQLPNPPIMIGITIKKIITKACAVTITL